MKTLMFLTTVLMLATAPSAHAQPNDGGGSCPAWTTPRCTAWSLGPPPKCTDYDCVADKASDPIKKAQRQSRPRHTKLRGS